MQIHWVTDACVSQPYEIAVGGQTAHAVPFGRGVCGLERYTTTLDRIVQVRKVSGFVEAPSHEVGKRFGICGSAWVAFRCRLHALSAEGDGLVQRCHVASLLEARQQQ